jgi:nucleotide-binding universal stress UspA family protein
VITIRRILCPTDFSDASRRALDYAVALAKWYDARLTVLHAAPVRSVNAFGVASVVLPPVNLTADERQHLLASMKQSVATEVGSTVAFDVEVAEGNPVPEILDRAATLPSDLIVLGTHGVSGFDRVLLGSVTDKVLRKAACPVLTVPPHMPDVVPTSSGLFRRILCAVDFSDCSIHALTYALSLAQEANAHLFVVTVSEHILGEDVAVSPSPALKQYYATLQVEYRQRLAHAIPESARTFCTVETRVTEGRAYKEILRLADVEKVNLIVIGVHGRGAFDRWIFGSTTEQVVRHATCPVLTIRHG